MEIIKSNLDDQLSEAITRLEVEERKHSSIRVLLEASMRQLHNEDEIIRTLKKKLRNAGLGEY